MFCVTQFGLSPRQSMEGFSRWWALRIVVDQADDGKVVAPRWPTSAKVPSRFLSAQSLMSATKAGKVFPAEEPLEAGVDAAAAGSALARLGEESVIIDIDGIPLTECHCKHEGAVALLLFLWTKEPRCRSAMQHEVFKEDHAALRRKVAPKRKSPSGLSAKGLGDVPRDLAPRPTGDSGRVGGVSTVLTTRAAARAAAGGTPPSTTPVLYLEVLPPTAGRVEGAPVVQEPSAEEPEAAAASDEDEPATPSPA
eukprot:TRINITY_DN4100_c0_g1_i1.p3 TRINITY_DN4100_c0_g1~~TRINITY_DN4100_c0_g1_i1.p3  ORF type:complete len:252 (+),score=56.13 TRINITY_DN4100_c0_g1_i1:1854-2609(+)